MCPFVYNCTPLGYSLFNHGTDSVLCFQSDGSIYGKTRVDLIKNTHYLITEQIVFYVSSQMAVFMTKQE